LRIAGMNMAANQEGFVPAGPKATPQAPSAWHYVCWAAGAALLAYGVFGAAATFLRGDAPPLLGPSVTIDKLPDALKALPPPQRQQLIAREQDALARDSLDRDALINLSLLYGADGQQKRAEDLAIAAANRALRDSKAQAVALQLQLKRGDVEGALYRIDALLRTTPDAKDQLFATLIEIAGRTENAAPVVKLLALNPPWRTDFIDWAAEKSGQPQMAYQLVGGLKSSQAPPTLTEMQSVLRHYIVAKDYATGYFIWLDLLSETELRKAGNVFDGGFDLPFAPLFFSWTLGAKSSVETQIVPRANGSSDNVLRVDFVDNRENVLPISQYLRLAAGKYIFSGDSKAENLLTDSGLAWNIRCIDGDGRSLASSNALSGNKQWDHFEARFEVPAGCTTQMLALRMVSPAVLDQKISGQAFYDNLTVTPLAAGQ
jgi:hypothetical protein